MRQNMKGNWATWHGKEAGYSTQYVVRKSIKAKSPTRKSCADRRTTTTRSSEPDDAQDSVFSSSIDVVPASGSHFDDLTNDEDSNSEINTMNDNDDNEEVNSMGTRDTSLTTEEPRKITVRFLTNDLKLKRRRTWESCNSSKHLFGQAVAAGIIKPMVETALLLVRVAGFEDSILFKGDEEDFTSLRAVIEDAAAVKSEPGGKLRLDVDVDVFPTG
ncbi:uncharacterized protein AB675_8706 [Cyphellophora attinorum]|uniref:Uncharacterized protein n=1 Tax=Cyphellophora attinorum TaxID=1664694 RepID=A0A0N0NQZ6_9EURO|nr:uncharacterized protein AB675_8706 [Phialophora attinorum]KPI44498.1 hypothetical protein AB675_8706 [Phialophora attinorum]